MQIGRGGVEAGFDAQRASGFLGLNQALAQFVFADKFGEAFFQIVQLLVDGHYIHGKAGQLYLTEMIAPYWLLSPFSRTNTGTWPRTVAGSRTLICVSATVKPGDGPA